MADHPPEPDDLQVHYVTVWATDPKNWRPYIDYPDWMSPYEAMGMLQAAVVILGRDVAGLLEEAEEEEGER